MSVIRLAGVAVALAATSVRGGAQVPLLPSLPRIGFVAGVSVANVSGNTFPGVSNKAGFNGGAYVTIPVTAGFAVQPELLYVMKGAKLTEQGSTGSINLNYVQIPVLARFNFPTPGLVTPNLYLGPAVSFKAGCTVKASGAGGSFSTDCDNFTDENNQPVSFSTVDVGAVAGGGLAFGLGRQKLTVGARYDFSFKNISTFGDAKNRGFSFLAGIEIPLGM